MPRAELISIITLFFILDHVVICMTFNSVVTLGGASCFHARASNTQLYNFAWMCWAWWHSGKLSALQLKGLRFKSYSSHHIVTWVGPSLTVACSVLEC